MAKPESKAPVAPPEATPAWTAPREEIAGPAAKHYWFGTRAARTNRPPYSPWPQEITLGPVGFPMFTTFGPRLSGDTEIDEGNRLIPTLPGQSGTLLPGCVAKLSDDDIAEAREALAYHALRVAGGVLSQIDYRPSLFREALLRLLELREGGGRELPKARTRLEGRYLAQLSTWDLNALRAYVGDPKLTKQLTPRRDTDVSIGGCVYLQPLQTAAKRYVFRSLAGWEAAGVDIHDAVDFLRQRCAAFECRGALSDQPIRVVGDEIVIHVDLR